MTDTLLLTQPYTTSQQLSSSCLFASTFRRTSVRQFRTTTPTQDLNNTNKMPNTKRVGDVSEQPSSVQSWGKSIDPKTGDYNRKASVFTGTTIAKEDAEANRYHVYASLACPWANRVTATLKLKGLWDVISVNWVDHLLGPEGWSFGREDNGVDTKDHINGFGLLREVYHQSDPDYKGNITVPVLYDTKLKLIVNNESSEIIRILNTQFNHLAKHPEVDLYPEALRAEIDEVNDFVYHNVNNGVYKCGFAQSQESYSKNFKNLFAALDKLEERLSKQRYLTGDTFTEADLRLWVTLIRFDAVYVSHFKCNGARIVDFPNLQNYTKDIYQMPGIKDTINIQEIKNHYFRSHTQINPHQVVPDGPVLDLDSAHDRGEIKSAQK